MKFTSLLKYESQDVVIEIIMTAVAKRSNAKGLPIAGAVPAELAKLVMLNHADAEGMEAALHELAGLFANPPKAGEFLAKLLKLAWPWQGETPSEEEILILADELLKHLGIVGDEGDDCLGSVLG